MINLLLGTSEAAFCDEWAIQPTSTRLRAGRPGVQTHSLWLANAPPEKKRSKERLETVEPTMERIEAMLARDTGTFTYVRGSPDNYRRVN